jgi:hypothetical protein
MSTPYTQSRSPPPLVHPRPSHISQPPPEPITPDPSSPYNPPSRLSVEAARASFDAARQSSEGYSRYSSPPVQGFTSGVAFGAGDYAPSGANQQQQSFGNFGAAPSPYAPFPAGPSSNSAAPSGPAGGAGTGMYNPGLHGAPTQPGQGFQSMMGGFSQWPMVGMNEATATMIGKAGQDYVEKSVCLCYVYVMSGIDV